ncbi:Hypothetical_protein [Hexamita inflata]|uniref:Hypothetical_protein n=1 Tax=Hexamita inflata TaxID=28002 RepID=A0ABP1HJA6_9EUKA
MDFALLYTIMYTTFNKIKLRRRRNCTRSFILQTYLLSRNLENGIVLVRRFLKIESQKTDKRVSIVRPTLFSNLSLAVFLRTAVFLEVQTRFVKVFALTCKFINWDKTVRLQQLIFIILIGFLNQPAFSHISINIFQLNYSTLRLTKQTELVDKLPRTE